MDPRARQIVRNSNAAISFDQIARNWTQESPIGTEIL
jgi:hypothetical protein